MTRAAPSCAGSRVEKIALYLVRLRGFVHKLRAFEVSARSALLSDALSRTLVHLGAALGAVRVCREWGRPRGFVTHNMAVGARPRGRLCKTRE